MTYIPVHHNSLSPRNVFFGMFDVLGFKHRVATQDLAVIVNDYKRLINLKIGASQIPVMSASTMKVEVIGTAIFSDTIVLWCDDSLSSFQSFVAGCCVLMATALKNDWPLRGGISYGSAAIDADRGIFVGQAIIDAHDIEGCQEWLGAAFHSTVVDHPDYSSAIRALPDVIPYAVPVKETHATVKYALHWGQYADAARSKIEVLKANAPDGSPQMKFQNALDYLASSCAGMQALN